MVSKIESMRRTICIKDKGGRGKRRRGCEVLKKLIDALTLVGSIGEVFERTLRVSLHGCTTLLPVGGTDFTVLVSELEGLDETKGLINGATDWEIIHRNLTVGFVSKKIIYHSKKIM